MGTPGRHRISTRSRIGGPSGRHGTSPFADYAARDARSNRVKVHRLASVIGDTREIGRAMVGSVLCMSKAAFVYVDHGAVFLLTCREVLNTLVQQERQGPGLNKYMLKRGATWACAKTVTPQKEQLYTCTPLVNSSIPLYGRARKAPSPSSAGDTHLICTRLHI